MEVGQGPNWGCSAKEKKEIKESKAIPVTGRGGSEGYETSKLSHFLHNRLTDDSQIVSLTRQPPITPPPQVDSGY
jgi:hypothetical protein